MPRDFNLCFYNFLIGQTNQYSFPTNVIYYYSIAASDDDIKHLDFNDNHDHLPKQKDSPKVIAQKIMEQRKQLIYSKGFINRGSVHVRLDAKCNVT